MHRKTIESMQLNCSYSIAFCIFLSGFEAITTRRAPSRCQTRYACHHVHLVSYGKRFANCISFILLIGAAHLRDTFYRMGLSDKDIVVLSGGHTLVTFAVQISQSYLDFIIHRNVIIFCYGSVGKGASGEIRL